MRTQGQKSIIDSRCGGWIILFALSVWVGCSQKTPDPEADYDPEFLKALRTTYEQDELEDKFGGASGLDVLATATKVRAYRVAELNDSEENGGEKIFRYTITSELREVDAATAKQLIAFLSDRKSYRKVMRLCEFEPAVGFRFENESKRIDVLVCFGCEEVYISPPGKCAEVRSGRLLAISKKVFPDDKVIQAIRNRE